MILKTINKPRGKKKPLSNTSGLNGAQCEISSSCDYALQWLFPKELQESAQNASGASNEESWFILSSLRVQNISYAILVSWCSALEYTAYCNRWKI